MPTAPPAGWAVAPLGLDCKLYVSDSFGTPTPSRTLISRAINVTNPTTKGKAELLSRMSKWKAKRPTLREIGLDFGYRYTRGTDTVLAGLRTSFLSDAVKIFWVMDGDIGIIGTQGWVFPGIVFDFPIDQQLEDGQVIDIAVDLAEYYESNVLIEPQWFVVAE